MNPPVQQKPLLDQWKTTTSILQRKLMQMALKSVKKGPKDGKP